MQQSNTYDDQDLDFETNDQFICNNVWMRLVNAQKHADVVFAIGSPDHEEEVRMYGHKAILSMYEPLDKLLSRGNVVDDDKEVPPSSPASSNTPTTIIRLHGYEPKHLLPVLRFMYTGRLSSNTNDDDDEEEDIINIDSVVPLYQLANRFGVRRLERRCLRFVSEEIRSVDDLRSLFAHYSRFRTNNENDNNTTDSLLLRELVRLLERKLSTVIHQDFFLHLPEEVVYALVQSEDIAQVEEQLLLQRIIAWARTCASSTSSSSSNTSKSDDSDMYSTATTDVDESKFRELLQKMFAFIRFTAVPASFIETYVEPLQVIPAQTLLGIYRRIAKGETGSPRRKEQAPPPPPPPGITATTTTTTIATATTTTSSSSSSTKSQKKKERKKKKKKAAAAAAKVASAVAKALPSSVATAAAATAAVTEMSKATTTTTAYYDGANEFMAAGDRFRFYFDTTDDDESDGGGDYDANEITKAQQQQQQQQHFSSVVDDVSGFGFSHLDSYAQLSDDDAYYNDEGGGGGGGGVLYPPGKEATTTTTAAAAAMESSDDEDEDDDIDTIYRNFDSFAAELKKDSSNSSNNNVARKLFGVNNSNNNNSNSNNNNYDDDDDDSDKDNNNNDDDTRGSIIQDSFADSSINNINHNHNLDDVDDIIAETDFTIDSISRQMDLMLQSLDATSFIAFSSPTAAAAAPDRPTRPLPAPTTRGIASPLPHRAGRISAAPLRGHWPQTSLSSTLPPVVGSNMNMRIPEPQLDDDDDDDDVGNEQANNRMDSI